MKMPSGFTGFGFPPEVILLAVRWYLRYWLSYRDLEELLAPRCTTPSSTRTTGVECDHGRLKARLRPMRGRKTKRTASVVILGYAFIQNLRRGHYELAVDAGLTFQLATAFDELRPPSDQHKERPKSRLGMACGLARSLLRWPSNGWAS